MKQADQKKQGPAADRIPPVTKMTYGLGTAVDMWGLWLYPGVAFAVFNIYLGVSPWLVGLALTIVRIWDAVMDPIIGWLSDNLRSQARPAQALHPVRRRRERAGSSPDVRRVPRVGRTSPFSASLSSSGS